MKIISLVVGPLQANCYLLTDAVSQQAAITDPGDEADAIGQIISQQQVQVSAILCTHGHPDHLSAAWVLAQAVGIEKIYLHPAAIQILPQLGVPELVQRGQSLLHQYDEGDEVMVGEVAVRVIHTPGHSPGSVCLAVEDVLFTGDTLFAGGVGRTDLPGGSYAELEASLRRIVTEFPPETIIYPGHGPTSTLARERQSNPWIAGLI